MSDQLEELKLKALSELERVDNARALESWRSQYLGRKSELTKVLRSLAALSLEERKVAGAQANEVKDNLQASCRQKEQALRDAELASARREAVDVTLPGRPFPIGRLHPITQTLHEICDIFASMGFQMVEGPEVEWDYYNFEALNMPAEHPARDMWSTFWVDYEMAGGEGPMLLRTHTTAVSARIAEAMKPPIRVIEPGRCHRYEASDATHTALFNQIDGFAVDKSITMADLKGTLYEVARRFFGEDRKVRFRCSYFPFVEPGVEMDIECLVCGGKGCRLCGNSGWLEILGAGMTHPEVLRRGGIDPDVYTSFAFGMGVERPHMLRYGINDIRHYFRNDLRFLRQF